MLQLELTASMRIAFVILCGLLESCTRHTAHYAYVKLVGDNYEVVEVGEPSMGYRRFNAESIPIRYRVGEGDNELEISIGSEAFVPDLVIKSKRQIQEIDVGDCARVVHRSDHDSIVFWSYWQGSAHGCVVEGDRVKVGIWLVGLPEPVIVEGEIAVSGKFHYYDSL